MFVAKRYGKRRISALFPIIPIVRIGCTIGPAHRMSPIGLERESVAFWRSVPMVREDYIKVG
jgi:hypothetical protein